MSQQVLELAQQGNADAIAFLLNRTLKPQGIEAKVANQEGRLQILLEGLDLPDESRMVALVTQGIQKLQVPALEMLQIYGKQTGSAENTWKRWFEVTPDGLNEVAATETGADDFGQGDIRLRAREGNLEALQAYVEEVVDELLIQARSLRPVESDPEVAPVNTDHKVKLELEDSLLKVTIETREFLDGPKFAAELGKKLNVIASANVKEFELYKQKTPSLPPFFIQRLTLDPSLQGRV